MNTRTPKAAAPIATTPVTMLLLELEMPNNTSFEAFEARMEGELLELELRFQNFVTQSSYSGSLGR